MVFSILIRFRVATIMPSISEMDKWKGHLPNVSVYDMEKIKDSPFLLVTAIKN